MKRRIIIAAGFALGASLCNSAIAEEPAVEVAENTITRDVPGKPIFEDVERAPYVSRKTEQTIPNDETGQIEVKTYTDMDFYEVGKKVWQKDDGTCVLQVRELLYLTEFQGVTMPSISVRTGPADCQTHEFL